MECFNDNDINDWNDLITSVLASFTLENKFDERKLKFKIKEKHQDIKTNGLIHILKNDIKIYYNNQLFVSNSFERNEAHMVLKNFIADNKANTGCDRSITEKGISDKKSKGEYKPNSVIVADITDSEWWTMVKYA